MAFRERPGDVWATTSCLVGESPAPGGYPFDSNAQGLTQVTSWKPLNAVTKFDSIEVVYTACFRAPGHELEQLVEGSNMTPDEMIEHLLEELRQERLKNQ